MNKYYIRIDEQNRIIKGFSDAFELPLKTDICISENGERHFELNGEINPPLFESNIPKYKYVNGTVAELTQTEKDAYKASLQVVALPPSNTELQTQVFNLTTQLVTLGVI